MKRALYSFAAFAVVFLVTGCGTSSTTTTGPSLDRCSITVVNSLTSVGASGGSGRLTVTAGRECTWSVTSNVPWITPSQPAGGQGDGTVDYVVAANPSPDARRGTVAMGGQPLEVVQEGLTCRFDLQPTSQNIGAEGGSGSFTVEAANGCNWTPAASDNWITITNGGSQDGNGSVNFNIAPNTAGVRDGTIRVGGQAFTILQSAPLCRFQLSAITGSFGGAGGSGTVTVTGASSCNWTASSNDPWVSIVSGASGTGNGTVSFAVQANTGPARNGILTIGGQRFTVTQQQAECSYSIAPAGGQSFSAASSQGSVTVSTNSICTWITSDVPAWVTGMPASGTGPQTLTFTVDANPGPARSAAIIIGGQSFAVSQAGGCSYALAPGSHNPPAGGGASSFAVNTAAGCGWTSSGVPPWITGVPPVERVRQPSISPSLPTRRYSNREHHHRRPDVHGDSGRSRVQLLVESGQPHRDGGGRRELVRSQYDARLHLDEQRCAVMDHAVGTGQWNGDDNHQFHCHRQPRPHFAQCQHHHRRPDLHRDAGAAAAACSYSLNPASHNPTAAGGSSAVAVTRGGMQLDEQRCASVDQPWGPANGTGTTTIDFTRHRQPRPRSAHCQHHHRRPDLHRDAGRGRGRVQLFAQSDQPQPDGGGRLELVRSQRRRRDAAGRAAVCQRGSRVGYQANGTGMTTINFTVTANPDPSPRNCQHHHRRPDLHRDAGARPRAIIRSTRPATTRRPQAARARLK